MSPRDREQLARYYDAVAAALDIPDSLYEEAVRKYKEVGVTLAKEDTTQGRNPPDIFPQGSFNLGTVTRPLSDRDEYDIDLVYRRDLRKESTTQAKLKEEAGGNLEKYRREKMAKGEDVPDLKPGRRCWTLTYDEGFHMDVLPAIPDLEGLPKSILITDTELTYWQHSNPQGYAEWFKSRMVVRLREGKERVAKATLGDIATVPEWRVKTPLQRAVQILKRHRDSFFRSREADKPASILITTLAAKTYNEEADILAALDVITANMERFIEMRAGVHWVANPVAPEENFADKWRQNPARRENFYLWLKQVRQDVQKVERAATLDEAVGLMQSVLGEGTVNEVVERLRLAQGVGLGVISMNGIPPLAEAGHAHPPSWPIKRQYKVSVTGEVYNKAKTKKLWTFNSSRGVPKHFSICFQAQTKVEGAYSVQWQVVNTGREAAAAGDLRGDLLAGSGNQEQYRWESTAYAGTHWVEAFIVKDGACLGRSGRVYVRILPGN